MGFQVYNSQGQELQNLTGSAGGDLTGTYPNPTLAKGPTYVTSLPSSPIDGQEIYYAADATNGVIWHLRYRSGSSSSYKWEYVGGPSLSSDVLDQEYSTSTSYGNLATSGPSIALPLAGDYNVKIGAWVVQPISSGVICYMSYAIGATAASDNDSIRVEQANGDQPRVFANHFRERVKTGLSAVTLTAKYKTSAGNCGWGYRTMTVTPVRVG